MAKTQMKKTYAMSVTGGGLVGLVAALKLAPICLSRGGKLALVAPVHASSDQRTTAMLMPSVEMLRELNVWDAIEDEAAALKVMRLIDGSTRLIRAPVTDFRVSELGLEAFGYNVPNATMIARLEAAIAASPAIDRFDASLERAECGETHVELHLDDGTSHVAQLAVAADGRNSTLRKAAGIKAREWSYPQTAIVLNFAHTLPHNGVSTEFHTETGPFTQVPLPEAQESEHRSSLVWVVRPDQAEEILSAQLDDLSIRIETRLQSCFGMVSVEDRPQAFPLSGMTATSFGANRVALVGESGHVFPPIGAQGFNLGLRDVADLSKVFCGKYDNSEINILTDTYNRKRSRDIKFRTSGIDVLNRSLLTDFLPVQAMRVAGMSALGEIPWLRQFAMRQGLGAGKKEASVFNRREKDPAATGR